MYRRIAAGLALAAFSLVPFAGASGAFAASNGWAATSTKAFPLKNATRLAPLPGNTVLRINVALALRNYNQLHSYILAVSTPGNAMFGQKLSPTQFASQYGPTASQVQSVQGYLTSQGLTGVKATPNGIYVSAQGTASQVETAFHTQLVSYLQHGLSVYTNTTAASVPTSLKGTVVSVLGLNDASRMQIPAKPKTEATPPTTPSPSGLTDHWAGSFQSAYDAKSVRAAVNTSIAIFAEGDVSQVVKDLRSYEHDPHNYGFASWVPVQVRHVGVASNDTAGLVEWDMDTQTSTGIARAVKKLYIYDTTSLTDSDVALEFSKFTTDDVAKAGSASFGECEYAPYLDGMMVANDEVMAEAAAQGQTVFASAGDDGGFCPVEGASNGVPAGIPDVLYPASSPYVVSAGGTTLYTNADGTYQDETAWVAGGGGPSEFEYQPSWQAGVAPPTADTCLAVACLGKDMPDVAMDADFLNSPADFYNNGAPTQNGGTSLASPLSLGSWALVESKLNNRVGFAAPALYAVAGTAAFHDVQLGDTGPYPATPGWDFATGNGSFDIAQMIKLIVQKPAPVQKFPVPSPACNLFYDNSGDANPTGSTGNVDSLDILSGGMSTSTDGTSVTGVLRLKSLDDGPAGKTQIAGGGDQWYLLFQWQGTTYFLTASYAPPNADPNNPAGFTFGYGHIEKSPTGGDLYNNDGTLTTAAVDTTKGTISITAPLTDFGPQLSPAGTPPVTGNAFSPVTAQTFELVGAGAAGGSLQGADSAGGSDTYKVGTNC